jgi:SMC interacting uncharacterized protein involved in chromosome segregation
MEKQIKQYQEKFSGTLELASTMQIGTPEDLKTATEVLSQLNKNLDQIKEEKEKVLKPLRAAQKAENDRWKPLEDLFKPVVLLLRGRMSTYQTAMMKAKEEADAKIAARMKPGKGNLKAETAIRKMAANEVEDKVEADSGSLGFRKKDIVVVTDKSLIPLEYMEVNESAVLVALKDGVKVPGAELSFEMVPVNKR